MAPGVDDLGLGQDQPDQADVEEVVRHLVYEQRRIPAVGAGVLDELLAETAEVVGLQFLQDARITRRFDVVAGVVVAPA